MEPAEERLSQVKWWFDATEVSSLPKQEFLNELEKAEISPDTIDKLVVGTPKTKEKLIELIDIEFSQIFEIK